MSRMKWEWVVAFSSLNGSVRLARKLLDRSLRPATITAYRPLLEKKTHVFLTQVLEHPDEIRAHLYQFVAFFWRSRFF
jgi:hypothetical protein